MATESIKVSARFPVTPERLYRAWLDSTEHGRFTGGGADIEPVVGGRFMSWDDYMTGMLLQLEPGKRIVMTLRTTEFPDAAPDSRLEVLFTPEGDGTRLTLVHTDIPAGDGDKYEDGWIDYYFEPMQRYFRKIALEEAKPHATHAAAKHPGGAKPKKAAVKAKQTAARPKPAARAKGAAKPNRKAARRKAAKVAKKRAVKKTVARAARKSAGKAKVRKTNRQAKRAAKKK
jgi:uncharacterized protein YndB with AHSA1/START domain